MDFVAEQLNVIPSHVYEIMLNERDDKRDAIPLSEKFKHREKEQLQASLELLPRDLVRSIQTVQRMRNSESIARVTPDRRYGTQILEVDVDFFDKSERVRDMVVFHEVGGHMVLNSLKEFSQETYDVVESRWKAFFGSHGDILQKDKNSAHESHHGKDGIGSLTLAQEEFIANRMAEYFARKSGKYSGVGSTMMRNKEKTFSDDEERELARLSEATYLTHCASLVSAKTA